MITWYICPNRNVNTASLASTGSPGWKRPWAHRAVQLCPVSPFISPPQLSARCPPITLIGEPKGLLSAAVWWVTAVHAVQDQPSGWSEPRLDATVCYDIQMTFQSAKRFAKDLAKRFAKRDQNVFQKVNLQSGKRISQSVSGRELRHLLVMSLFTFVCVLYWTCIEHVLFVVLNMYCLLSLIAPLVKQTNILL